MKSLICGIVLFLGLSFVSMANAGCGSRSSRSPSIYSSVPVPVYRSVPVYIHHNRFYRSYRQPVYPIYRSHHRSYRHRYVHRPSSRSFSFGFHYSR